MKLLFAAYDPAIQAPFGNYWAWTSAEVPKELPDRVRSQVIKHDQCLKPNSLARDDLNGGCVALDSHWCAFYRHYNGGRDLLSRPERGILLIGFANRAEAMQQDCSELLVSGLFGAWAAQQPLAACPARPNTAGDGDFDCAPTHSINFKPSTEVKDTASATAAHISNESVRRWNECQQLSASTGFHWRIKRLNGIWSSDVEPLQATQYQASQIREAKDASKFPLGTNEIVSLPKPKRERGTNLHLLSAAQIALGVAFLLGSLVGWTVHGLFGTGMSVTHGIDLQAAKRWAENYQSDKTGQQIPRAELLRRLQSDDWSETAHKLRVDAESPSDTHGQNQRNRR